MTDSSQDRSPKSLVKVVYFDEQSASDYLDISAGGKSVATSEDVAKRTAELQARVESKLEAKLSWLPFIGASASAGAGADASRAGQSILSKTLSNTILTDYIAQAGKDSRIRQITGLKLLALPESMTYAKMYTPYMVIAKTEDQGVDLARLDEALESAKGYYELLGQSDDHGKVVLRFNIRAFRNNYGLTDLTRMRLTFHGVLVGKTTEDELNIESETTQTVTSTSAITAQEIIDGASEPEREPLLDVYDILMAGVEHDE